MRVLIVTNDFPPAIGGIQSYVRDFVDEIVRREGPESVFVFAPTPNKEEAAAWDAAREYTVVRWPHYFLLPTVRVTRKMQELIRAHNIDTVWFGAAAPFAAMGAAAKRAGAARVVASTHGHEVGWSLVPGARRSLQRIGEHADTITYISNFTLGRLKDAFGRDPDFVPLPSGVDTEFFRPAEPVERRATRESLGVGESPLVVCSSRLVARKGQDQLIRAIPAVRERVPGTQLIIVGDGPFRHKLKRLARDVEGVTFTGAVSRERLRDIVAAADVFAMPARTRKAGLDIEGLGIVYLEAQACAIPVIAGDSGGAPETVTKDTGFVVDGHSIQELVDKLSLLLIDAPLAARMGQAGRCHVSQAYSWKVLGDRLVEVLRGETPAVYDS
ncbi:GDP-mannose-dependent alpha-(1-6)-phosphatidylinositol monomannoside mannosyltransferase [Corynebacterium glaucum]|uniref:GDP-mannose-dependent alpha-(1-6)-phosphatidylinositol monomannoside mannosyltransferase n=1 Tax=Corynebacterium glaucum TaxID=187491 RepID=A0A1Q2HXU4_9CORY|nr:glycosyltransferase family 4 protein [Corynebacterium glaucum]AQQ15654.1 GDP-mannose-dependent alpha-(1-6)-phosphatidylinositol monomannoside mannosyltransferase [Corynebacterium glaucum]